MQGCPRGALCLLVPDAIDYTICTTYHIVSLSLPIEDLRLRDGGRGRGGKDRSSSKYEVSSERSNANRVNSIVHGVGELR